MAHENNKLMVLPKILPILPVAGSVLMPRAQLPVPILQNEYMALVSTTLKTHDFLGIVQPILKNKVPVIRDNPESNIPIFKTGCLGKISDINELDDGRISLTLTGVCRFRLLHEHKTNGIFRVAEVDYTPYGHDLVEENDCPMDRRRLKRALINYFKHFDMQPNWKEINKTSNEKLITALAMICPFEASEKQAVLEAQSFEEQSRTLTTLIEIASLEASVNQKIIYH